MDNIQEARRIARNYRRRIDRLRWKSTLNRDNVAARQMIVVLTEMYRKLRAMGFRTTSESDPGQPGRVVPITQEWIKEQRKKETRIQKITRRISKYKGSSEGRIKLIRELMAAINKENP